MTDRELLELAAKAIGLKYHAYVDDPYIGVGLSIGDTATPIWNPLTDDGDALRLAVKINLEIIVMPHRVEVGYDGGAWSCVSVGKDPCAATRKAIVMEASSIGASL